MNIKIFVAVACGLLLMAVPARAQVTTAPTLASFSEPATASMASVHFDSFQCGSVNAAGACVNQAAAPFQTGVDIPASAVTILTTPDANGNNMHVALNAAPGSGLLSSLPAGVPFVMTAIITPVANSGFSASPRSAASNPFFASVAATATPTNLIVK
jgi:hypothetical protein